MTSTLSPSWRRLWILAFFVPSLLLAQMISNTATVTSSNEDPADSGNNQSTAVSTVFMEADLAITKTDGVTSAVPGQSLTYTIVATNAGPNSDPSAGVSDTFPADLSCSWTSVAAGGATGNGDSSGNLADTLAMPPGSSVTYTVSCAIDPAATGTLSNTATIAASIPDPAAGNNAATDDDTVLGPEADLAITKTDGMTSAFPGDGVTYTIAITNAGPSHAPGSSVTDVFPPALLGANWTCSATPGSSCVAAGSGDLAELADLGPGGVVTYSATGTIDPAFVGNLTNTASAQPGAGVSDPDPSDNSSMDTTLVASPSEISGTKDVSGDFQVGGTIYYTLVLVNGSASAQLDNPGDELVDALPPELSLVSASADSGLATVDLGLNTVYWNGTIPGGGMVEITIEAIINYGAEGSTVSNQATIYFDADGDGTNESSSVTDDPASGGASDPTSFRVLDLIEVPTAGGIGLALLMILIATSALIQMRSRRRLDGAER